MSSVRTSAIAADCCDVGRAAPAVNKLTDDSLLDIFDIYLDSISPRELGSIDRWHTLVHVCRRWRDLVFASPRRLNLRLLCNRRRSARIMLDIWPPLLIMIKNYWTITQELGLDNINTFTALEHPDRVSSIDLDNLPGSIAGTLVSEMRVPFPELTYLRLSSENRSTPDLPDSFLGGSAPRLQTLKLCDISFPALPKLLLSASDLVDLTLRGVPDSGYISPEAMVACLSALSRLKSLSFGFQSRLSRPNQPSPPPETRVVLPALTHLTFQGMAHYLDDFLARIDTPVLNEFSMSLIVSNLTR
ncbi:hypothetical protein BC826DRAFT_432283 [Russula brevipes]|nr:hypothetical protein BC826DRAFT_432283 [Russula brevipes]